MPRESFMRKREKGVQTGRGLSAAFVVPRRQRDFGRRTRIRIQEFAHQGKRLFIFRGRIRGGVMCRDDQILVAHVGLFAVKSTQKFPAMPVIMGVSSVVEKKPECFGLRTKNRLPRAGAT
jgi:hypothetical protein